MIKCAFCFYAAPFISKPADFTINGTSVCEDHVDDVSDQGFSRDLSILLRSQEHADG